MVTSNKGLIVALCSQAAISAAASSAALSSLAPEKVVAGVVLLNAMLSAGTAVYVALTGQRVPELPSDTARRT